MAFKRLCGKNLFIFAVLGLICLFALSFSLRDKDFKDGTGAQNLEATYHTLLTITALKSSPIKDHWLLPTISLGGKSNKNIPWGLTIPTKTGDYVYTSFTPPGFVIPYLAFKVLGLDATVRNLALFSFVLGCFISLLLFVLLVKMLKLGGFSPQVAVSGAFVGGIVSIFSREVLQSQGIIYWVQSFYQVILAVCLCLVFAYINDRAGDNKRKSKYAIYLVIAVFFGAWTEWTGYVFGLGLAVLFWFGILCERPHKGLSIKLIMALIVAGLVTIIHYGLATGFENTIKALEGRFLARSVSTGSLFSLLQGYAQSFGLFSLVAIGVVSSSFFGDHKDESILERKKIAFLFLVASIPLIENFIMLQHASQFSFDRLKMIFPLAIILAIAFARYSNLWRIILSVFIVFASIQGYHAYRKDLSHYHNWSGVESQNKEMVSLISKVTNIKCAVFLSNIGVRGYTNLLLKRGGYEYKNKRDISTLLDKRHACSAVYLKGKYYAVDLPAYKSALITKPNGSTTLFEFLKMQGVQDTFFITDANWEYGVSKKWSGFLVPNTQLLREQLAIGNIVILRNGDTRKIVEVKEAKKYLYVYISGKKLNPAVVSFPSSYIIRTSSPAGSKLR